MRAARRRAAIASLALLALVGWARPGAALTTPTLPSVKILTAPLISPTAAQAFYGTASAHTVSFGGGVAPPEIVETARALKNDPDLIFDFVHNQVEVEYAFGLRKGRSGP
ncbi:MAG: hypothetical protein ACR2F8_13440 [Caulobacteraceae bacterium]